MSFLNVQTATERPNWLTVAINKALDVRWLPIIFLLCAVPTGLQLAVITPVGQVADEPAHIARAAALLHGQIMGTRELKQNVVVSGVNVDTGLMLAAVSELSPARAEEILAGTRAKDAAAILPTPVSAAQANFERSIQWSHQRALDICPGSVMYFPAFYLPGALGLGISHVFGANPFIAIIAGRLVMLAAYLSVGFTAISVATFGRGLLFCILSLPMTLSIAASFNQGGLLIGTLALVTALLTLSPERPARKWAAPLSALVICSQAPYALLLFVALVPSLRPNLPRRFVGLALLGIPALVWIILMIHFALAPAVIVPYHPGPLYNGDHSIVLTATSSRANLDILLSRPSLVVTMPIAFIEKNWLILLIQAIGMFGWLQIHLTGQIYLWWTVSILASVLSVIFGGRIPGLRWGALDAILVLAILLASIMAVDLSLYLSWAKVGSPVIDGVQGRYYLLLAPMIILILPRLGAFNFFSDSVGPLRRVEMLLCFPAISIALIDCYDLPKLISTVFYN